MRIDQTDTEISAPAHLKQLGEIKMVPFTRELVEVVDMIVEVAKKNGSK